MRCYECGYQNESDVRVCIKCGTKLDEAGSEPAAKSPAPEAATPPPASAGAKTIRGKAADSPSWDAPAQAASPSPSSHGSAAIIKCPACQYYPLPQAPDAAHPCPNCGHGASGGASASKTVKVDQVNIQTENGGNKLILIEESSGREIPFSGDEINVNRDNIDPGNNAVSSQVHAVFSFQNGQLHLEDKSSNGATFIKVDGKMPVANNMRIILGNKVYKLKINQ
ncbi:hypothetical protein GC194_14175 [bacterium]|nr:hypothetical protein [bacterium]